MSLFDSNNLRDKLFQEKIQHNETLIEFLPYYSVEHILNNHPLPQLMKLSKKEIHKCLTHMFSKYKRAQTQKAQAQKAQSNTNNEKKIEHETNEDHICRNEKCKKKLKTICAYRDGCYVCEYCGCVQSQVYGEGLHLPMSEEELKILENGGDSEIPKWAFAENEYGEIWSQIVLNQHVEHWNVYVNMTKDNLEEVKVISRWMEKRASNECRVASAFIFKFIKDSIPEITTEKLLQLQFEQPKVKKTCEHCSEKFYSIFETKRHICKKKIERKQWSYVNNKKSKIRFI